MDRNLRLVYVLKGPVVALRKESVDRNVAMGKGLPVAGVALRKESVDRNQRSNGILWVFDLSLSARRAWIEISAAL